jgi:DNA-binding NtrC family response regulator
LPEPLAVILLSRTEKLMSILGLLMVSHGQISNDRENIEVFWTRELLRATPSLRGLIGPLVQAAANDGPVLLTGESGTGKTHLARLIHDNSARKDQPLLVLFCRDQPGSFEPALQGTLLLEDVDALSFEQQAQLLQVIETAPCQPVLNSKTSPCGPRVIATSKLNLGEMVARGQFHPELYDRLRVLMLHLSPLRERREDIGPLVRSLVTQFSKELGKGRLSLDAAALTTLESFPWPGNIRQLRNVVKQAVLASPGPELLKWDLPLGVREWVAPPPAGSPFRKNSFR